MLNKVMLEKKSRMCACAVLWQWDIFDAVKLLVDTDNKGHLLIPSFFLTFDHMFPVAQVQGLRSVNKVVRSK